MKARICSRFQFADELLLSFNNNNLKERIIMLFHSIEEETASVCLRIGPTGSCILLGAYMPESNE